MFTRLPLVVKALSIFSCGRPKQGRCGSRAAPLLVYSLISLFPPQLAAERTIEFETREVTGADVTLSPDGETIIITILGHPIRLPSTGGEAEQLTFGPHYDSDPVFSPDGRQVAFVSDRDGSESNVFVLSLPTLEIRQLTHETWAGRPIWTPDGEAMVYLSLVREAAHHWRSDWGPLPSLVRRVAARGGEPRTLIAPPREIRSLFHIADGQLAWTVLERIRDSVRVRTRIEALDRSGKVSTLRELDGLIDRVVADPNGQGLFCRRVLLLFPRVAPEHLMFLPLPDGSERNIVPVSGSGRGWGTGRWFWGPRFAVTADDESLIVGDAGRIWRFSLPDGAREAIEVRAHVRLDLRDPIVPPRWVPSEAGDRAAPRTVSWPALSPDGRDLVFSAAGQLWRQPIGVGSAQPLFQDDAIVAAPSFSPDGRHLGFIRMSGRDEGIWVLDLETQQSRAVTTGENLDWHLKWSPDSRRIIVANGGTHRVSAFDVQDGASEELADTSEWEPYPHYSADGTAIYFTAILDGTSAVYRLEPGKEAEAEALTELEGNIQGGLVSPNEDWLAFRRRTGIWVAPLGDGPVSEERVSRLVDYADDYSFSADGSSLIYSVGNRVWRHPLDGDDRRELPIRLELDRPVPPALLVRRVRLLDFERQGFGEETSILIEKGRIKWLDKGEDQQHSHDIEILDAGGRYAIPGLFDMHVHAYESLQAAFVAHGVTSVRNVGFAIANTSAMADRSESTNAPVPR